MRKPSFAPHAVIDLGTNTFHLLIARQDDEGGLEEIYRERIFVKLASDGIDEIGPAPYQRGLEAMQHYSAIIKQHQVKQVKAMGTAALRTAKNGTQFTQEVRQKTGVTIELISGAEEARLIHRGVSEAIPLIDEDIMLMDIGGGSVEFVIAGGTGIRWAQSFPIGVAVLHRQFHENDPITDNEIASIHNFLNQMLQPLWTAIRQFPVKQLVGASGTFDVIEAFLTDNQHFHTYSKISANDFLPFYQQLIFTTSQERLSMEKLPASRADLIVVAIVLIDFVLKKTAVEDILVSAYAMKEGILFEMMEKY